MARRKVSSLLALAVLSTVVERPMHPYEIASLLRARGKGDDMEIKWGSLYTVVANLAKHGFIEVAGSHREGGRPERTVYRITEAGLAELVEWTRELVATAAPEHPRFRAGLSVLSVLGPEDVAAALRTRVEQLEAGLAARRDQIAEHASDVPRLFLIEDEYDLAMRAAELAWVRALEAELRERTFPGYEMWRRWHETGEMPPDIAEMARRGADG